MEQPRFYEAASRLGIPNPPNGANDLNYGVEFAPDAILTPQFKDNFPRSELSKYIFPLPEDVNAHEYKKVLAEHISGFRKHISGTLKDNERQVVIGGDHSVSLPSALAVIDRIPDIDQLGYIHIDSHADMNLFRTSPSGNFHGIYLRTLLDTLDDEELDSLLPNKLPTENMLIIGNLDLDDGEKKFFSEMNLKSINRDRFRKYRSQSINVVQEFIDSFPFLHISLDIDVLDRDFAPATGIAARNGFAPYEIFTLLRTFKNHPNFSFDLVEVNPKKPGAELTVKTAQRILSEVLDSE
jgi:arginase